MSLQIESVYPTNRDYGLYQGVPIARFYIDTYIASLRATISGRVLEFGWPTYAAQIECEYEIIDINPANTAAALRFDISQPLPAEAPRERYDAIICTAVLQLVDDPQTGIDNLQALLKPRGILIVAEKCLSKVDSWDAAVDRWRFTPTGLQHLLRHFSHVDVQSFGNLYSTCAYLMGLPAEAISTDKLNVADPEYPLVAAAYARK